MTTYQDAEAILDRLVENIEIQDDNLGCWLWTRSVDRYGYAQVKAKGGTRLLRVHRLTYAHEVAELDDTTDLDHFLSPVGCPRHCVNPRHLTPLTRSEHARITWARRNAEKTAA